MSIQPGALVGRYRVVREIGQGDFVAVYRAYDAEQRRLVTLKVLHAAQSQDAAVAQRFQQEAAAAMRLAGHPHVLNVYATGQVEGRLFVATEFLPGATLDQCLSAPLDLALAARVVAAVAAALDAAHNVGLVHRDLKPANVVLGRDGRIAVADFGIAGLVSLAKRPTQAIRVLGTPEYLAPEIATGASLSPASDQYALAVMAYEMLTGRRPFEGDDPLAVLYAHTHQPPPPPTTLRPDLPPAVDDVILRALAKEPQQRFPTCATFAAALGEALAQPARQPQPEPPPADRALDALVERARELARAGDCATALRAVQVALAVVPEDQRLLALQTELEEEQRFAERYERALLHVRAHEWRPAREILNALYAERPDYRDVAELRAQAFAAIQQQWEKEQRLRPEHDPLALASGLAEPKPSDAGAGRAERGNGAARRESGPRPDGAERQPTRAERRAAERLADELGWRYDAALAAMQDGNWRTAVAILESLYERAPSFRDVARLLKQARRALAQEMRGAAGPPPPRTYRPARFLRGVLVTLLETSRKLRLPKRHRVAAEDEALLAAAAAEPLAAAPQAGAGEPIAASPPQTAQAAPTPATAAAQPAEEQGPAAAAIPAAQDSAAAAPPSAATLAGQAHSLATAPETTTLATAAGLAAAGDAHGAASRPPSADDELPAADRPDDQTPPAEPTTAAAPPATADEAAPPAAQDTQPGATADSPSARAAATAERPARGAEGQSPPRRGAPALPATAGNLGRQAPAPGENNASGTDRPGPGVATPPAEQPEATRG